MALVEKVTTELSFHEGVLVPAGTRVMVDTDKVNLTKENSTNLADVGEAPINRPVAVAPIAPTGPNPLIPQQVPPGAMQTNAGYPDGNGGLLVAAGGPLAPLDDTERAELTRLRAEAADRQAGTQLNDLTVDDDMPRRAGQAPATPPAGGFDADKVIEGTIPDVTGRLDGLTAEQLDAVQKAEDDREVPRAGVKSAIDAARAKLA